jgi:hypothetical protein
MVIARAISAQLNISYNKSDLYADDELDDSINEFTGGTLGLGGDHLTDPVQRMILGHEYIEASGGEGEVLKARAKDEGPPVGVGFYSESRKSGPYGYRAIWLTRVKFAESGETINTRGGNAAFQTPTVSGTIMTNSDGVWKEETRVDTEEKAKAWLDKKANIPPVPVPVVPSAPRNFTAEPGDASAVLAWTAPSSTGGAAITGYQVSNDDGGTWAAAGSNTGHTFTGLTNGQVYTFQVRAQNSAGNGAAATATATPEAEV